MAELPVPDGLGAHAKPLRQVSLAESRIKPVEAQMVTEGAWVLREPWERRFSSSQGDMTTRQRRGAPAATSETGRIGVSAIPPPSPATGPASPDPSWIVWTSTCRCLGSATRSWRDPV